jgi:hypothetical protein
MFVGGVLGVARGEELSIGAVHPSGCRGHEVEQSQVILGRRCVHVGLRVPVSLELINDARPSYDDDIVRDDPGENLHDD